MKINSAKLILEFFATYLFFDYAHSNFSSTKESSYKIQQRGEGEVEPDKTNLSGLNGLNDECQVGKAHHFSPFVLVVFGVEEGVTPQDPLGQLNWFCLTSSSGRGGSSQKFFEPLSVESG